MGLTLPNLPLEALPAARGEGPAVVVEPRQGQWRVVAANAAARARGIAPDLKLGAALALAEPLNVLQRSPARERAVLESLASWAHRITPAVDIEPDESLVLEIEGSRRLFGGREAIVAMLAEETARRGLTARLCVAPTAMAALWLSRCGAGDAPSPERLPACLGRLPVAVTRWAEEVQTLLAEMGVRTIGDCLRLPRAGFARRVGLRCLTDLDKALGRAVDVRAEREPPHAFRSRAELAAETGSAAVLIAAAGRIIERLAASLRERQAQIERFELALEHLQRPPTVVRFDLLEPSHEGAALRRLVADRLERLELPAPVIALELTTGFFRPLSLAPAGLFGGRQRVGGRTVLVERLQGRFGADDVHGLGLAADHRPERAWRKLTERSLIEPPRDGGGVSPCAAERPSWVLPEPVPLFSAAARSHTRGEIELESGPERIESGWWDGHDVGRDYYTAIGERGERLWVFRDHASGTWYLHGLFG
ncbi:MAG TPA: DNA polymerase Y family protein [Gammaproteobacteria bacterium]